MKKIYEISSLDTKALENNDTSLKEESVGGFYKSQ